MSDKVNSIEPKFIKLHKLEGGAIYIDANQIIATQAVTEINMVCPIVGKRVLRVRESVEHVGEILNGK